MELRPYQKEIIHELYKAYKQGFKSPCIVLGCGGGKSVIVADIAKKTTQKGNRVLFLVHRQELCEQIENTFKWWGVNMDFCTIGKVQTITRHLQEVQEPKLIITDENHHCVAKSYKDIYSYFPKAKKVGVTATPIRLNQGGLGDINDILIEGKSTKWLIANKYLAPFDYYSKKLIETKNLRKNLNGEYRAKDIEDQFNNTNNIYGDIIKHYKELADGKQAICYCATIALSKEIEKRFCEADIKAKHIDANTPKEKRKNIINQFRENKIKILCNVDLISEGFDVPDCEVSILLRPTKSLTLYIQQSMRCMRYKEGKRALIIDHVGNYTRFGLPDEDRKWSLDTKKKQEKIEIEETKVIQCQKCGYVYDRSEGRICPNCGARKEKEEKGLKEIDIKLEKIEGFKINYKTPRDCKNYNELIEYAKEQGYKQGWAWYQAKERGFI